MYFFKRGGKQYLDLKGDLILSHNEHPIVSRVPSNGPFQARNASGLIMVKNLVTTRQKLKAAWTCIKFIFDSSRSEKLIPTKIDEPEEE